MRLRVQKLPDFTDNRFTKLAKQWVVTGIYRHIRRTRGGRNLSGTGTVTLVHRSVEGAHVLAQESADPHSGAAWIFNNAKLRGHLLIGVGHVTTHLFRREDPE